MAMKQPKGNKSTKRKLTTNFMTGIYKQRYKENDDHLVQAGSPSAIAERIVRERKCGMLNNNNRWTNNKKKTYRWTKYIAIGGIHG